MTAPNIEMIAALLRSCKLGRGRRLLSPAAPTEASDESVGGIAVELNSETALPFHWEQCLDMRTGEVYYINRETGARTSKDPRTPTHASIDHIGDDTSSSGDSCSSGGGGDVYEDESSDTANSCLTSLSSTARSAAPAPAEPLVSAGCRSCFMYFMVPKCDDACPKCGGRLLKLGRGGCV